MRHGLSIRTPLSWHTAALLVVLLCVSACDDQVSAPFGLNLDDDLYPLADLRDGTTQDGVTPDMDRDSVGPDGQDAMVGDGVSDGIIDSRDTGPVDVAIDTIFSSCTDSVQDGGETDVDCGGPSCPPCQLAQRCRMDTDCITEVCDNDVCGCLDGFRGVPDTQRCVDIDECANGTQTCDANATCINTPGDFDCSCNPGFTGDGFNVCVPDSSVCADPAQNPCDANAACRFDGMNVFCACNVGYTGDGFTCTDIDECNDPMRNACSPDASCTNTPGSFVCTCNTGYTGDGLVCDDLDECANGTNTCDANATCTNTPGDFDCLCNPGFSGDGFTCTDIDECSDPVLNICDVNATCTNTPGRFVCMCNPGFAGDGLSCSNAIDCSATPTLCGPNASCVMSSTGNVCQCDPGYVGDGMACADVDECSNGTNTCDTNATCTNTPGTFTCSCDMGFRGDGFTCTDVDECSNGTATCDPNAACLNTPGSFVCSCNPGYVGNGTLCTDVDECSNGTNTCDTNATCTNTPGTFTCSCDMGFRGDGFTCTDIDECASGLATCDVNATCINITGGFTCACNPGWMGGGMMCTDVDECANGTATCDVNATCTNTPGDFDCTCNMGFTGNGFMCTDIDECGDPAQNPCDPNASCMNTNGSAICTCNPGYTGDGFTCTDLNECNDPMLNPCDANATCINTPGDFDCACNTGYVGNGFMCRPAEIVGALTQADAGRYEDGTFADSCDNYLNPTPPYLYAGATGDGYYQIDPTGSGTPTIVLCDMTFRGGGWTSIDGRALLNLPNASYADLTGNTMSCSNDNGRPSSSDGMGRHACRLDIQVGYTFNEIYLDNFVIESTATGNETTDLLLVVGNWGQPWCTPNNGGDFWVGTPSSPTWAISAGQELTMFSCGIGNNMQTQMYGQGTRFTLNNVSAITTPDTTLRFEWGEDGPQSEGWRVVGGDILLR